MKYSKKALTDGILYTVDDPHGEHVVKFILGSRRVEKAQAIFEGLLNEKNFVQEVVDQLQLRGYSHTFTTSWVLPGEY